MEKQLSITTVLKTISPGEASHDKSYMKGGELRRGGWDCQQQLLAEPRKGKFLVGILSLYLFSN